MPLHLTDEVIFSVSVLIFSVSVLIFSVSVLLLFFFTN